jgi:hypothetical protein
MKRAFLGLAAILSFSCCAAIKTDSPDEPVYTARNWRDVHALFVRFNGKTDGVVAEAFVDKISSLLDERWNEFPQLVSLIKKDPSFGPFIYRHLGDAVPLKRYENIKKHATKSCPSGLKPACSELLIELEK